MTWEQRRDRTLLGLPIVAKYLCERPKQEAGRPGPPQLTYLSLSVLQCILAGLFEVLFSAARACSGIGLGTSNPRIVTQLLATEEPAEFHALAAESREALHTHIEQMRYREGESACACKPTLAGVATPDRNDGTA
jgi:hypothetical protein